MFAVKMASKDGSTISLINNPSKVILNQNDKYYGALKPGYILIYGAGVQPDCVILQERTQTPLDILYGKIEKAFEENRMVTICLDS